MRARIPPWTSIILPRSLTPRSAVLIGVGRGDERRHRHWQVLRRLCPVSDQEQCTAQHRPDDRHKGNLIGRNPRSGQTRREISRPGRGARRQRSPCLGRRLGHESPGKDRQLDNPFGLRPGNISRKWLAPYFAQVWKSGAGSKPPDRERSAKVTHQKTAVTLPGYRPCAGRRNTWFRGRPGPSAPG